MSCSEYQQAIAEAIDGGLDASRQRALERHVEGCPACRALMSDLKTIQAAAFTLDRREPPASIWESVSRRAADEHAGAGRGRLIPWPATRTAWAVWLAAAALLVIATLVSVYPLLKSGTAHPTVATSESPAGTDPVLSVQAEIQAAAEHYDKAIQGLEQIRKSEGGQLDPQVAAVLEKNLHVIDQAIDESRAALKMQPASADAQDSLFDAMRTKVSLLQQTVELINEMRKGNQAEAGRLIQGLNQ